MKDNSSESSNNQVNKYLLIPYCAPDTILESTMEGYSSCILKNFILRQAINMHIGKSNIKENEESSCSKAATLKTPDWWGESSHRKIRGGAFQIEAAVNTKALEQCKLGRLKEQDKGW